MLVAWLALWLQEPTEPQLAEIRQPRGAITLIRGEQRWEVSQVARRIVNGEVFSGDVIDTQPGAFCDVLFADESRVSPSGECRMTMESLDHPDAPDSPRDTLRRVTVDVGSVQCDIVPNSQVETAFVTPVGDLVVRGTLVDLDGVRNEDRVQVGMFVDMGDANWAMIGGHAIWAVPAGTHLTVGYSESSRRIVITNSDERAATGEPVEGRLGAWEVSLSPEASLTLDPTEGSFRVREVSGEVRRVDGQRIEVFMEIPYTG